MALWRLYYHLVWGTKERHPLINVEMEPVLYGYILGKAHTLGGIVHAIGGMEDHIHMVVSIPPKISIADFVRRIKGSSAYHMTRCGLDTPSNFGWQRGYGIMSMGSKQIDSAVKYVVNQKAHHGQNDVIPALETEMYDNNGPPMWQDGEAVSGIAIIAEPASE